MNKFDSDIIPSICFIICTALVIISVIIFGSKVDIEKEKTKQLELQIQLQQEETQNEDE